MYEIGGALTAASSAANTATTLKLMVKAKSATRNSLMWQFSRAARAQKEAKKFICRSLGDHRFIAEGACN